MSGCPHAPYAEGPADFAIGLRPISEADWLEGGEAPEAAGARKRRLLAVVPRLVWAETPGSRPAQAEAADLVGGAAGGRSDPTVEPPLLRSALNIPDDLCLLERRRGD